MQFRHSILIENFYKKSNWNEADANNSSSDTAYSSS